ncbi:HNH endonuclease signature motif containing protein [Mycobacterium sp. SMC-4]|uniref:HNH endonuclease signature motif containing protein n=1 Tax=Mycobacterium sp. SMC-4 TaxID=2857059 RepID=UPI0021B23D8A|nr:HNH endonuclease signature motif containing protein [Mycobacterium sp. SMC-4]UXA18540.1 HNH endonuclease [Mycobacterium sp. SMC-4]
MFDTLFAGASDEALVELIEQSARQEARICARRAAAIAELVHRNVDEDDERGGWVFDPWADIAAQVAAALNIGQRKASGQMHIAVALRYRLPKIAALHLSGVLGARMVSEITWRTQLVDDPTALAQIDDRIAESAVHWGRLSEQKLKNAIDAVIERFDPDGLRRSKEIMKARDIHIGASDDPNETAAIWGRLLATDGKALAQRMTEMAGAVCEEDPRTMGERRSDAVGAIVRGEVHLTCRCGSPHCPALQQTSPSNVVIKIIADRAALDAATAETAQDADADEEPGSKNAPELTGPAAPLNRGSAMGLDGRPVPIALLAELIRGGAKVSELIVPGPEPEPRYRPSAGLAEFVRMRDLFCRFPGCDVPAERCDIDHVVPYPFGPTHPSNLSCECRGHHLMKTFWSGPAGWSSVQLPDGTLIWTAPTGHRYITKPGSRLYFPAAAITSADLAPLPKPPPGYGAGTMKMPRRRRPRAAENTARNQAERADNIADRATQNPTAERRYSPHDG